MTLFSSRLPHVLTRTDLTDLLTPTYARENGVSEELAHERMAQVLKSKAFIDRLYDAVSVALTAAQGSKAEDATVDALSKAVPKKRATIKPAPGSPGLSAVIVLMNIEIGLASLELRGTFETDKGRMLLDRGFAALAEYLVSQLVR